jgi:hypothetical protein
MNNGGYTGERKMYRKNNTESSPDRSLTADTGNGTPTTHTLARLLKLQLLVRRRRRWWWRWRRWRRMVWPYTGPWSSRPRRGRGGHRFPQAKRSPRQHRRLLAMTLETKTWRPRLLRRRVGISVLPGVGAPQLHAGTDQS